MRRVIPLIILALVGCSAKTVTVAPSSPSSASPTPAFPTPPPTSGPETFTITYEVTGNTGPGLPEKPARITFDPGDGLLKTITVRIDGHWSHNVEVEDGGSVELHVQASIFTSVECDVDSFRLLNPIKGKTDLNGNGWTCDVAAQTLSTH
jgi:hypothetical protein